MALRASVLLVGAEVMRRARVELKTARTCAAVALAGLLVLGAGAAIGHEQKWGGSVSFEFESAPGGEATSWNGFVRSRKLACRARRTVQVWRRTAGGDELIGSDRTAVAADGSPRRWEVLQDGYPPATGQYYVKVRRRVLASTRRHRHVCLALRTAPISVKTIP